MKPQSVVMSLVMEFVIPDDGTKGQALAEKAECLLMNSMDGIEFDMTGAWSQIRTTRVKKGGKPTDIVRVSIILTPDDPRK